MARISIYDYDRNITANDYLLGNDGDGSPSVVTKRFALSDLRTFLNLGVNVVEKVPGSINNGGWVPSMNPESDNVEKSNIKTIFTNSAGLIIDADDQTVNGQINIYRSDVSGNGAIIEFVNPDYNIALDRLSGEDFVITQAGIPDPIVGTFGELIPFAETDYDILDNNERWHVSATITSGNIDPNVVPVFTLQFLTAFAVKATQIIGRTELDEVSISGMASFLSDVSIDGNLTLGGADSVFVVNGDQAFPNSGTGITFGTDADGVTITGNNGDLDFGGTGDINISNDINGIGNEIVLTDPNDDTLVHTLNNRQIFRTVNGVAQPDITEVRANEGVDDQVSEGVITSIRVGRSWWHLPLAQSAIASVLPGLSEILSPTTAAPSDTDIADVTAVDRLTDTVEETETAGGVAVVDDELFRFREATATLFGFTVGDTLPRFIFSAEYTTEGGDVRATQSWDITPPTAFDIEVFTDSLTETFPNAPLFTLANVPSGNIVVTDPLGGVLVEGTDYSVAGNIITLIIAQEVGNYVISYDFRAGVEIDAGAVLGALVNDPANLSTPGNFSIEDLEGATFTSFSYDTQIVEFTGIEVVSFTSDSILTSLFSDGDMIVINGATGTVSNRTDDGTVITGFDFTYDTTVYGRVLIQNPITLEFPQDVPITQNYIGNTGNFWYGKDEGNFSTFERNIDFIFPGTYSVAALQNIEFDLVPTDQIGLGVTSHQYDIDVATTYTLEDVNGNSHTLTGEDLDVLLTGLFQAVGVGEFLFFQLDSDVLPAAGQPVLGHAYEVVGYLDGLLTFSRVGNGTLQISSDSVRITNLPQALPGASTFVFADPSTGELSQQTLESVAGIQSVVNYQSQIDEDDNGSVTSFEFASGPLNQNVESGGGALYIDVSGRLPFTNNAQDIAPGGATATRELLPWHTHILGNIIPGMFLLAADRSVFLPEASTLEGGDEIRIVNLSDIDASGATTPTDEWVVVPFAGDRILKLPADEVMNLDDTGTITFIWSGNVDTGWVIK